ncbi:hypothetical protein ACH5AL_05405 [Actinacidiphila glaucinigra]|uniref:hypothetical protein n=1 Tax=Actinacidiphila glaucinigra TaxID=235986 RepID=UPI0037B53865
MGRKLLRGVTEGLIAAVIGGVGVMLLSDHAPLAVVLPAAAKTGAGIAVLGVGREWLLSWFDRRFGQRERS